MKTGTEVASRVLLALWRGWKNATMEEKTALVIGGAAIGVFLAASDETKGRILLTLAKKTDEKTHATEEPS